MTDSLFENWKERCSSLGYIMTSLPETYSEEKVKELEKQIADLLYEKNHLKSINSGRKVTWTDNKQKTLDKLNSLKVNNWQVEDVLPTGAITHLDHIFNTIYFGRGRVLNNKYLSKGKLQEQDVLDIISEYDKAFYVKNSERLENKFLTGEPDNRQDIIRDAKSNWDKDSFDNATLTSIYEWQIKGYCFLDNKTEGELCYGLVNNPLFQILEEFGYCRKKYRLHYLPEEELMDDFQPDDPEEYKEDILKIERNFIFDVTKFKAEHPNYVFKNKDDFSIPVPFRVKKFNVTFSEQDKEHIIRRIIMCREYLQAKEKSHNKELAEWNASRNS